ncbi:helix-turn-helix domain-containing protein [Bacillus alveayuensis]|uniref:helix-turn-helix domain-containing protein n=1 Tax=Aeribacillus alveayuensis TaxID=279215 RepID=UPI0005CCDA03|nr:helix-turn-helix transcriptional regulator [Bacillus alveayuensis]
MERKHVDKYKKIGQAIKETRKAKGLSQAELAKKIGMSKSYISKIEAPNTDKPFSLEILFDIAEALEVSVTSFFQYVDNDKR